MGAHTQIEWAKDGSGFYYRRYPEPPQGELHQAAALNQMISFHKIGTKQADDKVVYCRPDHPDWNFEVKPTDDGKYLVLIYLAADNRQNQVLVRDASAPADAPFKELIGDFKNQFWFLGNEGTKFFYPDRSRCAHEAHYRDGYRAPGPRACRGSCARARATLDDANILSGHIFCHYLVDVLTQVEVFDLTGKPLGKVELPGKGTAVGFEGNLADKETFFVFMSYNRPWSIYRYDVLAGTVELVRQPSMKFDPEDFVVEQVFYKSKDGTRVPMMLTYRKNMDKDRPHPTLLYGYGGFNAFRYFPSSTPSTLPGWNWVGSSRRQHARWRRVRRRMARGRQGSQKAKRVRRLHRGRRMADPRKANNEQATRHHGRKQRRPFGRRCRGSAARPVRRLHPHGRSDGHAPLPEFTTGPLYRDEYGHIEKEDEFKAMVAYSPYHNIKQGTHYPPTLIMTADTDDRVVPMHSFKFAAAMQRAQNCDSPILLRVETRAGHGAGTPLNKQIESTADWMAFLVKELGMKSSADVGRF